MALIEAVKAIDAAADDKHIKGLFVDFTGNLPLTQAEELRRAVENFRAHKKPAFAFADTFGEQDTAAGAYYLASAFDKIWLQPMGHGRPDGCGQRPVFPERRRWRITASRCKPASASNTRPPSTTLPKTA